MRYRTLGRTGLEVSVVGLGTNSFGRRADARRSKEVLAAAVEAGINLIDTANTYGSGASETLIGEALGGWLKSRRPDLVIATKVGIRTGEGPNRAGASRQHILSEVERSLKRLRTDYIDLLQMHIWDPRTPLEETLAALDDLVQRGLVRYIGASNYRAWEIVRARWVSDVRNLVPFQSVQLSYSLADRTVETEVVPALRHLGMGLIAYYPLAGGILTGKYSEGIPTGSRAAVDPRFHGRINDHNLGVAREVARQAHEIGRTPGVLALAWLIGRPAVSSAIAGATQAAQVVENIEAADLEIPRDTEIALERASEASRWMPPFGLVRPEGE